jgi:ABC-2 type transport system permease protein
VVALIVRLKWQLLRNGLRRSTPQLVGMVLSALYGLAVLAQGIVGLITLRFDQTSDVARIAITIGGSAVTLGWALLPVIAYGIDETLDPARFATFSIPRRQLVLGLLLSSLVSIPAAVTTILAFATVITWSRSALAVLVAPLAAAVGVLTCVAFSRVTATAFSAMTRRRRGKEVVSLLVLFIALGIGVASSSIMKTLSAPGLLAHVADVLGWTPLGLAWAAPAAIVEGAIAAGLLRLALAVVFLVLALLVWDLLLRGALENPRASSGSLAVTGTGAGDSGLGWFSWLPATPTGAVAARSMTSWRRDPRYVSSGALMLLLPLGLLVAPLTGGNRAWSLAMAPAAGFLLGWSTHNDIAYDGTAFWGHVATGLSGRADRIGRLAPTAMAAAVLLPVYAAVACALTGRWSLWPALFGIGLGFLLSGFGVASVMSALKPYPVPGPGENPFGAPPGSSALTIVVQAVAGTAVFVLNVPLLALGVGALLGHVWLGWLCVGLAVVLGSGALSLGTWWGARIYERHAPELLADLARIR